ncbi:MAG: DUF1553 domain-containing protein [Verrucomicrobiaceae bacterium]|nr:DUF1553 domain-containing protein [Verrucomicrobiaceae bacterium]
MFFLPRDPVSIILAAIIGCLLLQPAPLPAEDKGSKPGKNDRLWALEKLGKPINPEVQDTNWPRAPIDHFILQKIEKAGLRPTRQADRRTLVRRAYLDLHGIPPTTGQLRSFLEDREPDTWKRLIEELLASPRYGERWGRHWLDVARYADSNGMDEDIVHPVAFRYRDYVIASFNNDKPFDRFIIEQLAGDLMPADTLEEQRRQTLGVGFLSIGPKMLACDDPDKMRRDIVDEQIDTTGRAFMGMTFGCARCHDHKFDPVSIEDYYGLAGIFLSTKTLTKYSVVARFHQHDLSQDEHTRRRGKIATLEKHKADKTVPEEEKKSIEKEIQQIRKDLPPVFEVMGVTEYPTEDAKVHLRGDYQTLGKLIPRRLPKAIAGQDQPKMPSGQSGRLQLANWIASPDHPLTARVIANRIWHWHFGRGIVTTPDNFGHLGQHPSHPALLDHLALLLIESGWSIKHLHRVIMNSSTYRQSSIADSQLKKTDPENSLFARWKPRRIESEVLRDSILFKSNRLDLTMGGSMLTEQSHKYVDRKKQKEYIKSMRRTIYLPVLRSSGYDSQKAFDFPDPAVITGKRNVSSVTPQALYLMNSEMIHNSSKALAEVLLGGTPEANNKDRASWLILHLLGREATPTERERGEIFADTYGKDEKNTAWAAFSRALFATNEFLYIQ